jgi:hypothetical protein
MAGDKPIYFDTLSPDEKVLCMQLFLQLQTYLKVVRTNNFKSDTPLADYNFYKDILKCKKKN